MSDAMAMLKVNLPKAINFLRVEGMEGTIDVGLLTAENAEEIGEQIKQKFIVHAERRRSTLPKDRSND